MLNFAKTLPNYSEELQKSVSEIIAECQNVEDPDRCESGVKIMDCLMEGADKRGIKPALHGNHKH